jgi:hypothetical protein
MPLHQVLPYEANTAKWRFPSQAVIYLKEWNESVGTALGFSTEGLRELIQLWWNHSVALRRFCLSFLRLHAHYNSDNERTPSGRIEEQTPIDFLILCALHVEKLLVELNQRSNKSEEHVKGSGDLISKSAIRLGTIVDSTTRSAFVDQAKSLPGRTLLHKLPESPAMNPFLAASDFQLGNTPGQAILRGFANFLVVRNYSAHHDCRDHELTHDVAYAQQALEGLLVTALLNLRAAPPP